MKKILKFSHSCYLHCLHNTFCTALYELILDLFIRLSLLRICIVIPSKLSSTGSLAEWVKMAQEHRAQQINIFMPFIA